MSTTADQISLGSRGLPRGGFKATLHIFRQGRWWPPDTRFCKVGARGDDLDQLELERTLMLDGFCGDFEETERRLRIRSAGSILAC